MDGKSNKKIVGCLFMAVYFLFLCLGALFFVSQKEAHIRNAQMTELVMLHPEMEDELLENFSFYEEQSAATIWHFGIFLTAAAGMCTVLFSVFSNHWDKKEKKDSKREADAIYEQLLRFRKGDFEIDASFFEGKNTDEWLKIKELLRELGIYFAALKEQLAEEENSTKALITDISHQLKTPLASLRMSHELAKAENLSDAEQKEFLGMEEQEINKLESLLDELVKLSRLECHMIQIKPECKSMKQTITEAVNQVFMKAHCKNIEMCVEMQDDVMLKHDVKWTTEALVNVMDNAIKYSASDTMIKIRAEKLPGNLLLEVEDEGMGISEDEVHKIFQRFYRGEKARESVKEGAGVGLYLARSILEQQGGTIVAKRKLTNGTIFKITLPL